MLKKTMDLRYKSEIEKQDYIQSIILCFLFPPAISTFFSLYQFFKYKNKSFGILFFIFFTLTLTYNFFSVDNILRFFNAHNIFKSTDWISGDPLTYFISYGNNLEIETSLFFYFYILLVYLFWFFCYLHCKTTPLGKYDILIIIFAVILRNAIDLLYYTLSISALLFLTTRIEKVNLKDYIYIIPIIFILHPGVLLILLPSIGLYYLLKKKYSTPYYIYMVVLYLITYTMTSIEFPVTGIQLIDSITSSFTHYTNKENKWGLRQNELSGITYFIQYYAISTFYFIIFIFSIKHRNKIKQKYVLAAFQCAIIMLPCFWNFVTITERLLVALSLTSFLCLSMLIQENLLAIKLKYIAYISIFIFAFNFFRASKMELSGVFKESSYSNIPPRSLYIPSILLFDYQTWGFSDEFIQKNTLFRLRYLN